MDHQRIRRSLKEGPDLFVMLISWQEPAGSSVITKRTTGSCTGGSRSAARSQSKKEPTRNRMGCFAAKKKPAATIKHSSHKTEAAGFS